MLRTVCFQPGANLCLDVTLVLYCMYMQPKLPQPILPTFNLKIINEDVTYWYMCYDSNTCREILIKLVDDRICKCKFRLSNSMMSAPHASKDCYCISSLDHNRQSLKEELPAARLSSGFVDGPR